MILHHECFHIRRSPDQGLLGNSSELIAALLRPSSPLSSLGIHRTPLSRFLILSGLGNLHTTTALHAESTKIQAPKFKQIPISQIPNGT